MSFLFTVDELELNRWQKVDISWHETRGLHIYIDDERVADVTHYVAHAEKYFGDDEVYIGKASGHREGVYANGIFDELEFWFAALDVLKAFDVLTPGLVFSTLTTISIH